MALASTNYANGSAPWPTAEADVQRQHDRYSALSPTAAWTFIGTPPGDTDDPLRCRSSLPRELIDQVATEQTPENILQRVTDITCAVLEHCAAATSPSWTMAWRPRTVVDGDDVALRSTSLDTSSPADRPFALRESRAVLSSSEDQLA